MQKTKTTERVKTEILDKIDWRIWEIMAKDVGKFEVEPQNKRSIKSPNNESEGEEK